MLLDDVMSELDPSAAGLLAARLAEGGQALITATEADQLPGRRRTRRDGGPRRRTERPASAGARARRRGVSAPPLPAPLGSALRRGARAGAPKTLLAAVQSVWPRSPARPSPREAEPVAERDGVVTVACRSATWAQELDLLQTELLGRLNGRSRSRSRMRTAPPVASGLRFTADAPRHARLTPCDYFYS